MDGHAFEARFRRTTPIGLVPAGVRLDVAFAGTVTGGPLAGWAIEGIDHLLIRRDGVSVIDARDVLTSPEGATVAAAAQGLVVPPFEVPPLEALVAPDFAWQDVDLPMHGSARFETAVPELQAVHRTVYAFVGTANVATGRLAVRGTSIVTTLGGSGGDVPLPRASGTAARVG